MTATFTPLNALQSWYDTTDGNVAVHLYLLDGSVSTLLDSYGLVTELPGRVPTSGSYNATTGIDAGNWPLHWDTDAACLELSLPAADGWASTATYSLTFRWVVVALTGGYILTAVDFGIAQTLTAAHLTLYAAESALIPNSYPVFRWRKA